MLKNIIQYLVVLVIFFAVDLVWGTSLSVLASVLNVWILKLL